MKRKFFMFLLAVVSCLCVAFAFSACTDSSAAVTAQAAESATICTEEHDACKTAVSSTLTASSASDCAHEYKGALTPATCTTSSYITYTCTICGYSYTDYSTSPIKGHTYGEAEWTWAEDYSSASVTLTCTVCGEVDTAEATVTVETYSSGETVYTATATLNEVDYVDTITVEPEEPADMVVGVEYTVSLNEDTNSIATTVTTEAEGYYTVSISDNAYITIYDADGLYYYNSNRMDLGYIADNTNYDEDVPVLIPAGTTLNVVIGLISSSSSSTSVTALIDIATEEEVYNQDITLAMDPDTEQRGYVEITYTTTEAGNYTFTLSGADKEEAYAIIADENWDIYEGLNINTGTGNLVTGGIYSTTVYVGAGVELTISLSQLESDDASSSINLTITYIYAPAPEGSSTGNTFALDEEITISSSSISYTITIDEAGDYILKLTLADGSAIDYTAFAEDYSDLNFWVGSTYYNYSDIVISSDSTYCYIKFGVGSGNVGDIEINFDHIYSGSLTYTAVVSAVEESDEPRETVEGVYNIGDTTAITITSTQSSVDAGTVLFNDEHITMTTYGSTYAQTMTTSYSGTVEDGVYLAEMIKFDSGKGVELKIYADAAVTIYYGNANAQNATIVLTGSDGSSYELATTSNGLANVMVTTLNLKAGVTYTFTTKGTFSYGGIYSIVLDESHVHSYVAGETVAPTCTEQGYTTYTCECGDSYVSDYVDALGHTAGETVVEKEVAATCTTVGSYDNVVYCTVCGAELSRVTTVIPATGHTYGSVITFVTPATCTEDGSIVVNVICSVCNEVMASDITTISATGHSPLAAVVENEVAATCTEDGSYDTVIYCAVCGEEISRETTTVPALGHTEGEAVIENVVEATGTTDGSYDSVVYCTVCGTELSRETITVPALGHTAGEAVIENEVAATCTEAGSYDSVVYCTVCGIELSRETIAVPALGHTYGSVITDVTAATCTEDGLIVTTVKCAVCGETIEETTSVIPATGHYYVAVVTEPTCTEAGYTTYTCAICGDTYTEEGEAATGHVEVYDIDWDTYVDATCTEDGSYDYISYCEVCGEELSRETITIDAYGHLYFIYNIILTLNDVEIDASEIDYTNIADVKVTAIYMCLWCYDEQSVETVSALYDSQDATCTEDGYVEYVYTINFNGETEELYISAAIPATGHTAGEAVIENEVAATCTEDGSYDTVIYCSVCGEELSRETTAIPATGHTAGSEVLENIADATCTEAGSADVVIYCSVCGYEIDRQTITTDPATGHNYEEVVTDPTCTEKGYTTYTCSVCGDSYTDNETEATGHTPDAEVIENEKAENCTTDGSYDTVVYCSVCGEELSRETIVIPATGHNYYFVSEEPATCTEDGYYIIACDACGNTFTVTIDSPATGHNYEFTAWTWAEDYSTATITFTCTNSNCGDVQTVEATITIDTTAEDCGNDGKTVYTATATFEGVEHTDSKTVVLPATGNHSVSGTTIVIGNDGYAYINGGIATESELLALGCDLAYSSTAATCTDTGLVSVICEVCGNTYYAVTPTIAHSYKVDSWAWETDYSEATLTLVCSSCGTETQTVTATVTSEVTTEPTCKKDGVRTYTATATFNGVEYTTTATEAIAATGEHTVGGATVKLGEDKYIYILDNGSWVKATYDELVALGFAVDATNYATADATCEDAGLLVAVCSVCGDNVYAVVDAIGHDYEVVSSGWSWAADYSTATVTIKCNNCGDEQTVDATITSEVTTDPTCTAVGETTYTATATYDGVTYIDTATEEIAMIAHTYGDPAWTWAADYSTATATFTCSVCGGVQTVDATVSSTTTDATCTENGSTVYTAVATFESTDYTGTQTVVIDATGHSYTPAWTWETDYSATLTLTCSVCTDKQTPEVTVTNEITTDPTCTEVGERTYTATATFNGVEYSDIKTVEIAEYGHTLEYVAAQAPTCTEIGWYAYEYCTVCGYTTYQEIAATGEHSINGHTFTIDSNGYIYFDGSSTAATQSELIAYGGSFLTSNCTKKSYGTIVCDDCDVTYAVVLNALSAHTYEVVSWTWSEDPNGGYIVTVDVICSVCGTTDMVDATVTSELDADGNTVYTATYGSYTDTYTVYAVIVDNPTTVTLSSATTTVEATMKVAEEGYYTVEVTDGAYIIIESEDGQYGYKSYSGARLLRASAALANTANYIVDNDGNPALIPAGTVFNIWINLVDTEAEEALNVEVLVNTAILAGEDSTVSLDETTYSAQTVVTILDEGYYTVSVSDNAYITIYDEDGLYYYSSQRMDIAYIADNTNLDEDVPVLIPANTKLYVICGLIDTETATDVTYSINRSMVAGVEYTVSLNEDENSAETIIEIEEEGYYTVSVSENGYVTVYDDNGLYYYNSNRMEIAYIADNTNYDEDVPVLIPAGTTLHVVIGLLTSSEDYEAISASINIDADYVPAMVAGVDYVVSLDSTNYSVETTITITEAGYYTVTVSDNAYILVQDDNYTYYYHSMWVSCGYIIDYWESDEVVILIPADTVLNVVIGLIDTDTATEVTALIAIDADYEPATPEPEYDFELTSEGLEAELEAGASAWVPAEYTVYVSEAGTYVISVDADGDITVEINGNDATAVYEGGSEEFELAEGDILTISAYAATTVTITVAAEEPEEPDYTIILDNELEVTLTSDSEDSAASIVTSYTTEEAGYYTFTITCDDASNFQVIIQDSTWEYYSSLGYNYRDGSTYYTETIYIPADTELTIYFNQLTPGYTDTFTFVVTYSATNPDGEEPETYDYTLTADGLEEVIEGETYDASSFQSGIEYTVYVEEGATFVVTVAGSNGVEVGVDYNDEVTWISAGSSETFEFGAGDTLSLWVIGEATVTINVYEAPEEPGETVEGVYNVSAAGLSSTTLSAGTAIFDDEVLTLSTYGGNMFYSTGTNANTGLTVDKGVDVSARIATSYAARGWTLTLYSNATVTIYYGISNTAQSITITGTSYEASLTTTTSNAWYVVSETLSLSAGTYTIAITGGTGAIYSLVVATAGAVEPTEPEEMVAGEEYVVSLDSTNYSVETTITITEAGYYTVSVSDNAYILVQDDNYTYYYHTLWVSCGYIIDYWESDEVVILIPANTVLNVVIGLIDTDTATEVTALIAIDADYEPATPEPEYDFELTSEGLEAELESDGSFFGTAYTIYVSEAGTYVISVDADGDITVETENTAESVYDGVSLTIELAEGETFTIYAYAATTVTITVAAEEEPVEPDYTLSLGDNEVLPEIDYTYTAEADGTYSFTLSGEDIDSVCVWAGEDDYNNSWDADYLDVQNDNAYSFTLTLTAGETVTLYITGTDGLTITIAEAEEEEPAVGTSVPTLVVGENAIVLSDDDGANGYETTFTATADGEYTFSTVGDNDWVEIGEEALRVHDDVTQTVTLAEGDTIKVVLYSYDLLSASYTLVITYTEPEHTHTEGEAFIENEVAATCTEDGSYDSVIYCTECGEEISRETITVPALGHTAGEAVIENEVAATCTEDGSYDSVIYCTECGEEISRETITVPALGHNYEAVVTAPTCTEAGYTTYTCAVCGDSYTADETEATGHDYEAVVTAPTCTEAGYTTYTCTVCGDSYTADETEATGHDYEAVVTAPTCTEAGYTTYTCTVCGDSYTADEVAALGHSYTAAWVWAEDYASATVTLTCSVCDDTQSFTSETITSATDTDGNTIYTATYTYSGVTYTASVTVAAPTGNVFDGTIYSAADLSASSYAVGEEVFEGITIVGATVSTWSSTYSSDDSVVTYTDLNGNTVKLTTALSIGYSKTKGISFTLTSEATIVLYYAVGSTSSFYIYVDEENEEQVVVLTPTATSTVMMAEFTLASGTYSIHCSKAGITGYLYAIGISDGALYIASEDSTALTLDDGYEWDGDEGVGYYVATEYELAAGTEYTLTVANSGVYTITAGNSDVTFGDTAIGANTSVTLELYAEEVYAVTSVADVTLAAQYVDVAGVASMMTVGTTLSWVSYNEETILAAGGTMYLRIDAISSASDNYYARITGDVENITVYYSAETDDTDVVAAKDSYAVVTLTDDGYYYITLAARAHGYFKIVANSDATITVELDAGGEGGEDTSTYVAIALDTVTTLELLSENSTYMVYLSYEAAAAGDYTLTLSSNHSWWTSYLSVMLDSIVVTVNGTTVSSTDGSYALSLVAGENKIVINYKLGSGMVTGYTYTALLESGAVEVTYEELSVGANEIPLADGAEYAEATYQFTATTAGTYTFTVSGDEIDGSVLIASDSSYTATVYLDQAATEAEQGEEVPYSFTLNLEEGETITLYIYNPDGTLTLTITAPVTEVTYTVSLTATSDTSTKYTIAYADNNVDEAATVSFDYSDIKTLKEDKDKTDSDGKNGYAYAYEIKASRPMVITVADGAEDVTLTFYISHSTTTDTRTVYVGTDTSSTSGTAVLTSFSVGGTADDSNSIDYLYAVTVTLTAGDTYYIWSDNTMHLYGLTVTYTVAE